MTTRRPAQFPSNVEHQCIRDLMMWHVIVPAMTDQDIDPGDPDGSLTVADIDAIAEVLYVQYLAGASIDELCADDLVRDAAGVAQ